jgi:hypothetical protein
MTNTKTLPGEDEGELKLQVYARERVVILDFGKQLRWLGLTVPQALELAELLRRVADEIHTHTKVKPMELNYDQAYCPDCGANELEQGEHAPDCPRRKRGAVMSGGHTPGPWRHGLFVESYIRALRNEAKRRYARAYVAWLYDGGKEPDRGTLSVMGAQAVRLRVREYLGASPEGLAQDALTPCTTPATHNEPAKEGDK